MATAAAAVVARARRDVVSHFMQANAVAPDGASTWISDRPLQQAPPRRQVCHPISGV